MTENLEDRIRQIFAQEAAKAPPVPTLVNPAYRRAIPDPHKRRAPGGRTRRVTGSLLVAASVVSVSFGGWQLVQRNLPGDAPRIAHQVGPLPDSVQARCIQTYTPAALPRVSRVAFDGNVRKIGPSSNASPYVTVEFQVNEWLADGSGSTVKVLMLPPVNTFDASPPSFRVGTRLLVSGNPSPTVDKFAPVVAEGCGFTRYYEKRVAHSWRSAFH